MDGQRFDDLARLLGKGVGRRSLFRAIGLGVGSLLGATRTSSVTAALDCDEEGNCPEGSICCEGICKSTADIDCCSSDGDPNPHCPPGYVCVDNSCREPGCYSNGCSDGLICCDDQCIDLQCCVSDGVESNPNCPSGSACVDGFCGVASCPSSDYCESGGVCCDGVCRYDVECCADQTGCPEGYLCSGGVCFQGNCQSDGDCPFDGDICCGYFCTGHECCPGLDTAHCASNEYCAFYNEGGAFCQPIPCSSDGDCGGAVCCDGECYGGACCAGDPNDAHCPSGTVCFEGVCDQVAACVADADCESGYSCLDGACVPSDPTGKCCDALKAGLSCAPNECCTQTASPSDYCPAGSSCEGPAGGEGVCCVLEGQSCLTGTPCCAGLFCTNGLCAEKALPKTDKWALWSGDHQLGGATIYVRRTTSDDDPKSWGKGPFGPAYSDSDLKRLATSGANYVDLSHPAIYSEDAPFARDKDAQASLDDLVKQAEKADLYVVISFRTGPGRSEAIPAGFPICRAGGCFSAGPSSSPAVAFSAPLWSTKKARDAWVALWRSTAKAYAKNPVVIGYHLMAMPDAPDTKTYLSLLKRIISAVREEDPETPILISAPGAGSPEELKSLKPLDGEHILYMVNTFAPARYLRQAADAENPLAYGRSFDPGEDGESGEFDAAWLAGVLKPALTWAADNRKPVAIGGYGIPRRQPELAGYLTELLRAFSDSKLRTSVWSWHPENGPVEDDAFNLEHGDDLSNHQITKNELIDLIAAYWKSNKARPSTGT